jgi:hypothetical protein
MRTLEPVFKNPAIWKNFPQINVVNLGSSWLKKQQTLCGKRKHCLEHFHWQ